MKPATHTHPPFVALGNWETAASNRLLLLSILLLLALSKPAGGERKQVGCDWLAIQTNEKTLKAEMKKNKQMLIPIRE